MLARMQSQQSMYRLILINATDKTYSHFEQLAKSIKQLVSEFNTKSAAMGGR
jgi:hypothetical protein